MKWLKLSWKIGRLSGVEIRLHFSILFSIPLTYYIFRPTEAWTGLLVLLLLLGFTLSVFLHELAHALAAKLVKVEVKNIVLWLLGGFTFLSHEPEKPSQRLLVYFAGPFMTLLLAASLFAVDYYMPSPSAPFWIYINARVFVGLAVINAILFVFNILPAYPLDGGNILHALTELFFGKPTANLITMIISIPVLIGLIFFGVYTHDYLLLVFCVFIALAISTLHWRTLRWADLGINYLFRRGAYYYLQGDYDRTIQYLRRNIERKPRQINNYILRSACYIHTFENENALADLERALAIDPRAELPLLFRGDIFFIEKNYDSAWEWYDKAHQLHPNSALSYYCCGCVNMAKREFQAALDNFNKAISLRLAFPLCYTQRSMVYFRLGSLDAAHKDQDSALLLSEKDSLTRAEFNLQVYEGYLDWAEDYYGRVLSKRPRSWYAYQGRADIYRVNHEYEKAITDYTKALRLQPREPGLYLGRGRSYLANGELDCAAVDFRHILAVTNKTHLRQQAQKLLVSLEQENASPSIAWREPSMPADC